MAKQNVINKFSQDLTIDPGASGDSFIQFDINTTGEFRIGVDDDASDSFKISQGSTLGANDTFVMTSAGERTMPLQPAFLAYLSTTATNVTGDSTTYTIIFDTEVFDQNSDYNNSTGQFTAPISGRYILNGNAHMVIDATGGDQMIISIYTSNRSYNATILPTLNQVPGFYGYNNAITCQGSVLADMDAGDVAEYRVFCGNNSKTDDVYGGNCYTWFSGYLAV